jgi:hypothetical protein
MTWSRDYYLYLYQLIFKYGCTTDLSVHSVNKVVIWSCHCCSCSCMKANPQQQRIHVVTYGVRSGGNKVMLLHCITVTYDVTSGWRIGATYVRNGDITVCGLPLFTKYVKFLKVIYLHSSQKGCCSQVRRLVQVKSSTW